MLSDQTPQKVCPNCGTSLADYRRTMLFGCAECYKTFRAEILAVVQQLQGSAQHAGKVPSAAGVGYKYSLVIEQDQLREKRAQAVRDGRYTDAAKIRDRLKEISRILHPKEEDVT